MIDRSMNGTRCRTIRSIAHHGGYLSPRLEGTVCYAIENLGRRLLRVDFDSGASLIVLLDERGEEVIGQDLRYKIQNLDIDALDDVVGTYLADDNLPGCP
jgi:hypothetical protein